MIGSVLANRYEIVREVGRGGMGVVYLARDLLLERDVAVKMLAAAAMTDETEERFRREARVVAKMDHPGIVPLHDFARHEDAVFFVMPFIQGTSLRLAIEQRALSLADIVEIGVRVAEALDYSHGLGVVHRDIKPENIMVERDAGGALRVRVADFGIAAAEFEDRVTKSGVIVGTGVYLSPEQIGEGDVDGRTDVYALGVVLYECLAGRPPFSGAGTSLYYRITFAAPKPLATVRSDVPSPLEEIVLRCLEKSQSRRHSSARSLADALRAFRSAPDGHATTGAFLPELPVAPPPFAAHTHFVGREREFADLVDRMTWAAAGESQFVVVAGDAGIGKSRLLDELELLARARQVRVLHGRFLDHDRSFPYQGFCDVIQEHLLADQASDLSDLAPELAALFPALGEISSLRTSGAQTAQTSSDRRGFGERSEIYELLARALARVGAGRPLAIFLEDLHASDVSIEALQYVVRRLSATPTLFVATYRTSEVDRTHPIAEMLEAFRGDRRFSWVRLGPLSPAQQRALVGTLVETEAIAQPFLDRLYEVAEGNPYFTIELVRSLTDTGGARPDPTGTWTLTSELRLAPGSFPETIQAAVAERVKRLAAGPRDVLAIASVLGRRFEFEDLEELAGDVETLDDTVDWLVEVGFLEEEHDARGDLIAFTNGIVRDVLYAGLSRRRRRALHRAAAERLERRHASRPDRTLPMLVHHFAAADVTEKVVQYGLLLARRALDTFSDDKALGATATVLDALSRAEAPNRAAECEALTLAATAHQRAGDLTAALNSLSRAADVASAEPSRLAEIAAQAAEIAWSARDVDAATRWVERGLATATAESDDESADARIRLLTLAATLANLRGEFDRAAELLDRADRLRAAPTPATGVDGGATLLVGFPSPLAATHPINIRSRGEQEAYANVVETLVRTDPRGVLVPHLASGWELDADAHRCLLTIRAGVRAHDGRVLDARELKRAVEAAVRAASGDLPPAYRHVVGVEDYRAGRAAEIAGLVVTGLLTVEVHLDRPLPVFPALLTDMRTALALADAPGVLVGTGPFAAGSFDTHTMTVVRNPQPWSGPAAGVAAITFRGMLAPAELAAGVRGGTLDLARGVAVEDTEEFVRDRRRRFRLVETTSASVWFLLFNTSRAIGADPALRAALASVARVHDTVRSTLGRFAEPAERLVPPSTLGHDPDRRRSDLPYERAAAELADAPPGRMRVAVTRGFAGGNAKLVDALAAHWADHGVEVELVRAEPAEFLDDPEFVAGIDVLVGGWIGDYADPDAFTYALFHSHEGAFRRYHASTALDALLEAARNERLADVRERLYHRVEEALVGSSIVVPLFFEVEHRLATRTIVGLTLDQRPPYVSYATLAKRPPPETEPRRAAASGVLNVPVPVGNELVSLDPALIRRAHDAEVLAPVFETLMRMTDGARVAPWLAGDVRVEEGGTRFRFRLRDDVVFHNGHALTSRDVRYSIERLLRSEESVFRGQLDPIRGARELIDGDRDDLAGFRIVSRLEFTIDLERPVSFFPALLAHPAAGIVPEGAGRFDASWRDGIAGTGPFQVRSFDPGRRLELEAYPAYWRAGFPRSETLVFSFGVGPKAAADDLREGRASIVGDLMPEDEDALRHDPAFAVNYREAPVLQTAMLVFNTRRGPFADEAVRHHVVRALDVEALVSREVGPRAVLAHGLIPPGLVGHDPARHTTGQGVRGRRLASEVRASCLMRPLFVEGASGAFRKALFAALATLGVNAKVAERSGTDWEAARDAGDDDMFLLAWTADYPDAAAFTHGLLDSETGWLGRFCGTPEIDRLIARSRTATDPERRHDLYREIEAIVARRALLVPLFHARTTRFTRPEVRGLELQMAAPFVAYERIWIER